MSKKPKQDRDLLKEIRERYDEGWSADIHNRRDMESDLRFLAGEQWPEDVRREREEGDQKRPVITENRLAQFPRHVANDMRLNPPSVKILPTDDGAERAVADIFTGMIRNIEAASSSRRPYVTAGASAARCGIGHWRIVTEYTSPTSFEQCIKFDPITNPFAVTWDPLSQLVTREDADWCFVGEEFAQRDFEKAYDWASVQSFDNKDGDGWTSRWFNSSKEAITVAEYWRKRREPDVALRLGFPKPDGSGFDYRTMFESEMQEVSEQLEVEEAKLRALITDERETERTYCECIKTNGAEILEEIHQWPVGHIPIIPVVGEEYNVGTQRVRHSVIRFAKDSQQMHNYWLSSQVEHLALQPKAPFLATADHVKKYADVWKTANTKNHSVLIFDVDEKSPLLKPERAVPPQSSTAFTEQIARAGEGMKATVGIFDAGLGMGGNETSGRAIEARDHQGDVATFEFRDNLDASVEYCGRQLVALIPKIYDTPRIVRILGEDGEEDFAEINKVTEVDGKPVLENVLSMGEYDAQVKSGPAFTTRRREAAENMLNFVQQMPQAAQHVMDLVAKNMDWPGADEFAERFKKLLPPNMQPETDDPEELQERAAAQKAAEAQQQQNARVVDAQVRKEEAAAASDEADAQKKQAEATQTQLETMMASGELEEVMAVLVQAQVQRALAQLMPQPPAPQIPNGPMMEG